MIVTPTVDVEGAHGDRPFEQMVLGEVGDRDTWGAPRLARVFQRYGVRGTFFVDVYECSLWGADKMERICQELAELGHDVQLHTHPGWRDDSRDPAWLRRHKAEKSFLSRRKDFMAKLSYDEQVDVLQAGVDMFQRWLGRRPVAHRSGGYSVNADTLRALAAVGIEVDSSMNASHDNSQVVWTKNRVERRGGLLELPVTVMNYVGGSPAGVRRRPAFGKLLKTDINICSAADLRAFVERGTAAGLRFMNLFMHSYSLLDCESILGRPFSRIRPCQRHLRTLEAFLEAAVSNPAVQVMSVVDALGVYRRSPEKLCGADHAPTVFSPRTLLRHAGLKARRGVETLVRRASDRVTAGGPDRDDQTPTLRAA